LDTTRQDGATELRRNKSILLVEDNKDLALLNRQCLRSGGYAVDVAEDGLAGWEALHRKRYDLLVTDNNMPRLSGLGLVKKLRTEDQSMPVIIASGSFGPEENKLNRSLNIGAIVPKPFSGAQLIEAIETLLFPNSVLVSRSTLNKAPEWIGAWVHGGINE